jgi:uncharacterized ferritin-like protein (DUF455 family)
MIDPERGVSTVFHAARECLAAADVDDRVRLSTAGCNAWRAGELRPEWPEMAFPSEPARPVRPRLVPARAVPRRRLGTPAGRAAFVHAVAHIEFNAIGLAWDCAGRFPAMPREFYGDWISVAADETRHFTMLRARLRELGRDYGDFEAHDGLWEMARKTAHDLLARLALVPRVLEARALDVTPGMIARLRAVGDEATAAILAVILEEEVAHVAAGSRWFRFECERRGVEPAATFRTLVSRYWTGEPPVAVNREYRLRAGFSEREL